MSSPAQWQSETRTGRQMEPDKHHRLAARYFFRGRTSTMDEYCSNRSSFELNPLSVIYILFNLIGNGTTIIRPCWLLVVTNSADTGSMRDVIQLMGSCVAEDVSYVFQSSG